MEADPAGENIALVIELRQATDGEWYIRVDGTSTIERLPLAPAILVARLWHAHTSGVLRGIIQLHGSDLSAPIQSNVQLERLVRAWLLGGTTVLQP